MKEKPQKAKKPSGRSDHNLAKDISQEFANRGNKFTGYVVVFENDFTQTNVILAIRQPRKFDVEFLGREILLIGLSDHFKIYRKALYGRRRNISDREYAEAVLLTLKITPEVEWNGDF
jgi:hypothetical protein